MKRVSWLFLVVLAGCHSEAPIATNPKLVGRFTGTFTVAKSNTRGPAELTISPDGSVTGVLHLGQPQTDETLTAKVIGSEFVGSTQLPSMPKSNIKGTIKTNENGAVEVHVIERQTGSSVGLALILTKA